MRVVGEGRSIVRLRQQHTAPSRSVKTLLGVWITCGNPAAGRRPKRGEDHAATFARFAFVRRAFARLAFT